MELLEYKPVDEAQEMAVFLRKLLDQAGIHSEPLEWKTIKDPELAGAFTVPTASGSVVVFCYPGLY